MNVVPVRSKKMYNYVKYVRSANYTTQLLLARVLGMFHMTCSIELTCTIELIIYSNPAPSGMMLHRARYIERDASNLNRIAAPQDIQGSTPPWIRAQTWPPINDLWTSGGM